MMLLTVPTCCAACSQTEAFLLAAECPELHPGQGGGGHGVFTKKSLKAAASKAADDESMAAKLKRVGDWCVQQLAGERWLAYQKRVGSADVRRCFPSEPLRKAVAVFLGRLVHGQVAETTPLKVSLTQFAFIACKVKMLLELGAGYSTPLAAPDMDLTQRTQEQQDWQQVLDNINHRASTKMVGSHEAFVTDMQKKLYQLGEAEGWSLPDGPACLEIPEDKRFCPRTE